MNLDIIFTWELGYLKNFVNGGKIVNLQEYLYADMEWKIVLSAEKKAVCWYEHYSCGILLLYLWLIIKSDIIIGVIVV